jgi:hypothetical protein
MNYESSRRVTLSLIAHTNVGKTTLARTLLRRDIGEVLDQPHVTEISEAFPMVELETGEILLLWDTPGFGDTARLLRRLRISDQPIGWILTQVWDRIADRPFWCSQQAIRNVRDEADVVLYLVNSAETPSQAGYVELEMEILQWIGKPVLVLLNQTGQLRDESSVDAESESWRRHLERFKMVHGVLSLDAFTRCWIHEHVLLDRVEELLAAEKKRIFHRLKATWEKRNWQVFEKSMGVLADQLAQAVCDREYVEHESLVDKFHRMVAREAWSDKERAMAILAERLSVNIARGTDELIRLHSLEGNAAIEILEKLKTDFFTAEPMDEGIATVIGGCISGAITGLGADLLAGGFTFGGGAVLGAIVGAVGAKGLARGYNFVRGDEQAYTRCSAQLFEALIRSALLRYLSVAHFGRGRGQFVQGNHQPEIWQANVTAALERRRDKCRQIWEKAGNQPDVTGSRDDLQRLLDICAREILSTLYPSSAQVIEA